MTSGPQTILEKKTEEFDKRIEAIFKASELLMMKMKKTI